MFIYECSSYGELLTECLKLTLKPGSGGWFFRGQRDSRWSLRPSVLRSDLPLPNDDPKLLEESTLIHMRWAIERETAHPQRVLEDEDQLLALAQHYGCKTRLLDWSSDPAVALYFAAHGALRAKDSGCESFSVFAMAEIFLNIRDGGAKIVRPPRGVNPNLAAQRGLHTKASWDALDLWDDARATKTRKIVVTAELQTRLIRFDVPTAAAQGALQYLYDAGVHGATLFPGPAGVARLVDDMVHLDEMRAAQVRDDRSYFVNVT